MAFPTPAASPTSSNATADDASPFTVARPAGVAGRLIIALIGVDGNPTLTWPSGYTEFFSVSGATNGFKTAGAYHWDDGTEGTTFDITSSASEKWGARVYSITGAANPAVQVPQAATLADQASSATPDGGPSLSPTGGAKDYLWLSWLVMDGEEADDDTWGNSCPTGFTDFAGSSVPHQKTTGVGGVATTNVSTACCQQKTNAASMNPGTYGVDVAHIYHSVTIAIHPATIVDNRAEVSWAELEVPTPDNRAEVSWAELEVPTPDNRAEVSWAALEVPSLDNRAEVSWAELEVPEFVVNNRAEVSWTELEVPTPDNRADVSWAELEVPTLDNRADVSWAELQVPSLDNRAEVSWAELEVPDVGGGGVIAVLVQWLSRRRTRIE